MIDLKNNIAVVTGGGKGIGRAIAVSLAEHGADVIIIGRDDVALNDSAEEIRSKGVGAFPISADITNAEQLKQVSEVIENDLDGRVDIIVTAAGTRDHKAKPLSDIDMAHFDTVMQGNLNGSLLPIRTVLPFMTERRRGKIVTVSGVFGLRGKATHGASCASKWALEGMTRVLALELGAHNINVNAICPGYVEGPRSSAGIKKTAEKQDIDPEKIRQGLIDATALKRLSTPEDLANAVLFLVSEQARNITGQDIVIDAGWTL